MIDRREEIVFSSRTRQRRRKFRVAQRPAEGHYSPKQPDQQNEKRRVECLHLKAEAREDARADHVSHRQRRAGDEADFSKIAHIAGTVGKGTSAHKSPITPNIS